MNIVLYNTSSENNAVTKVVTGATTLTGNIKAPTSVINPTIAIQGNPLDKNYAYISDFHRYYYIKDVRIINSTVFELDLEVDPLMSFASQIKGLTALVTRQEHDKSLGQDIFDNELVVKESGTFSEIKFSGGDGWSDDDGDMIIITNSILTSGVAEDAPDTGAHSGGGGSSTTK